MHPSAERLFSAVLRLRQAQGVAAIAREVQQSAQAVKNWESRGVSAEGALLAQELLGVSAVWILHGRGPQMVQPVNEAAADATDAAHEVRAPSGTWDGRPRTAAALIDQLARLLDALPAERGAAAQAALQALAMAPDSARACAAAVRALEPPTNGQSKQNTAAA